MIEILHLPSIPRRNANIKRHSKYARPVLEPVADIVPEITVVNGWQIFHGLPPAPTTTSFDGGEVLFKP